MMMHSFFHPYIDKFYIKKSTWLDNGIENLTKYSKHLFKVNSHVHLLILQPFQWTRDILGGLCH
jgi:hypothetical protein